MNLIDLFLDSTHFATLKAGINNDTELQEVLLSTQVTLNSFLSAIGEHQVSDVVADTFMLYGEMFNDEFIKYFSVCAMLKNKQTDKQTCVIFPFVFSLTDTADYSAGLHFNEKSVQR